MNTAARTNTNMTPVYASCSPNLLQFGLYFISKRLIFFKTYLYARIWGTGTDYTNHIPDMR